MEIKTLLWKYTKIKRAQKNLVIGEYSVVVRVTKNRVHAYLATGYSSSIDKWDTENELPLSSHPQHKGLILKIEDLTKSINFENTLAEKSGQNISPAEIKLKIEGKLSVSKTPQNKPKNILAYFDYVITSLEEAGNPGYADVFYGCKLTVEKLLNNKDKPFILFTKADHEKYEKQISVDTSESTISHYLRTYYRIWNLAIKDGFVNKKDHHPSQFITFKAYKRIRTKKRAINSDHLQRILKLRLPTDSRLYRSQKLIQFLYYARGMNFNDMLKLKWEQFVNDGIEYKRSKNHRPYHFALHKKAIEAINIFNDYPVQSDAGYIFPFLMSIHDTARKISSRIDSALKDLNEDFKTMAEAIGWKGASTSYVLRHGIASHLRDKGVDIRIIKEVLGHETEEQTQVYLDDIDDGIIVQKLNEVLD